MSVKTREEMIADIRKWVAEIPNPDEPFIGSGQKTYSPRQMLEEIEADTELGRQLLDGALKLEADRDLQDGDRE